MARVTDCEVQVVRPDEKVVVGAPSNRLLVSRDGGADPAERDTVVFLTDPEVDVFEAHLLHFNLFDDSADVVVRYDLDDLQWHVDCGDRGELYGAADGVALKYCGDRTAWREAKGFAA